MNQTEQYQLNQWEKTDRIQMEDFNADNLKTEQALAEMAEGQAALAQALAGCGNCQLYYGSYVGKGSGATAMSFDKKPLMVTIMGNNIWITAVQGASVAIGKNAGDLYAGYNTATWSGNSLSLTNSDNDLESQCNKKNTTYYVVALMDAST